MKAEPEQNGGLARLYRGCRENRHGWGKGQCQGEEKEKHSNPSAILLRIMEIADHLDKILDLDSNW